jgi:hypothetical protein
MQISHLSAAQAGAPPLPGTLAAAGVLNDPGAGLDDQLKAYHDLAGAWRGARGGERAALAQVLTDSPFAQKVQSTLDAFTRAAWAGQDAAPPAPQAQILAAFDALSEGDRQIVSSMQADASGRPSSPETYRARLQSDLDAAQAQAPRKADAIVLSREAQAVLAGGSEPAAAASQPPAPRPDLAAAFAAYSRTAR